MICGSGARMALLSVRLENSSRSKDLQWSSSTSSQLISELSAVFRSSYIVRLLNPIKTVFSMNLSGDAAF